MEDSRITEVAQAALRSPDVTGDVDAFVARLKAQMFLPTEVVKDREGVYSGKGLRRWVSQLKSADAVWKSSGFGVGGHQLKSWGRWLGGVGALTTVVVFAIGIKYNLLDTSTQPPKSRTYTTVRTQRASIILADGSQVVLAPATTLTVTGRNVELNGEAVFTVTQHAGEPFTVRTNNVTTHALGTKFGIQAYDSVIRVAVADGRVGIGTTVLSARDVAVVNGDTTRVIRNADVESMLGWTSGRLVFQNTQLQDALAQMSRWYGLDFRAKDVTLLKLDVNTVLPEYFDSSRLDDLADALGARITRTGNTITFVPKQITRGER